MQKIIKKLFSILTFGEKKRLVFLMLMTLVMALFNMIGVVSIVPFITVLTNSGLIETNYLLSILFEISFSFGIESKKEFLIFLGIIVFSLLVLSLIVKAVTIYYQLKFVKLCEYTICRRLVENYIHQPYAWFLNRHSADLGKSILSEVQLVINQGLKPLMDLITYTIVSITLLILLIFVDPIIALVVGSTLGLIYGLIYKFTKLFIQKIGKERLEANQLRFVTVNEIFASIKEIKLRMMEKNYIDRFSIPAKIYAKHQASSNIISQLPRYGLEALAFGGILLVILYMMVKVGNFYDILPIITLYAFAGYRLIPALQNIFIAITQLRFVGPAVHTLHKDLKSLNFLSSNNMIDSFSFKKNISLNSVLFKYINSSEPILKNINLDIPVGSTVGIVGTTGSGKTTVVDIITGLLEPNSGKLKVDEHEISKQNLKAWQLQLGYVPQQTSLIDESIAANISFGSRNMDQKKIQHSAKIACLHDFIINNLPEKYDTVIGERGVRLSGGQRQRIGIARALYHNPKVLILDEATNALDNSTERDIMKAIYNLNEKEKITIIIISHRLSTLQNCENIFFLQKGKIVAKGVYSELLKSNDDFAKMANKLNKYI